MDSLFIYTARRSLIAGHVVDETYHLEIALMEETTLSRAVEKTIVRSKGGAMETLHDRADENWSIVFEPVRGTTRLRLKEFLDSTESGQTFQAYLYGTESEPLTLKRTDSGYQWAPFRRVGSPEGDWYQASAITAVEV
jgi:hypothetical protein